MKTWQETIDAATPLTIHTLVKWMNGYLAEQGETIRQQHEEELARMFAEYGDRAYGALIHKWMAPLGAQLHATGFGIKAGFQLSDSIERWGPPEERERNAWYVVHTPDGATLGTAVLQFFHSHTHFHLPRPPRFLALEETTRDNIVQAVTSAAFRLQGAGGGYADTAPASAAAPRWEYGADAGLGDSMRPQPGQTGTGYLDHALDAWGRHGWELVSVVPYGERVIGFFKRPTADGR